MFEQRKTSLFSSKENAFVMYKDLRKEADNSAGCFTLEQEVTDTMTSTLPVYPHTFFCFKLFGEALCAYEEAADTFPLVLKNINR